MEVRDVRELRDFAYRLVHPGGRCLCRTHHVFTKHSKYVFMVTKALMDLGGRVHTVTLP